MEVALRYKLLTVFTLFLLLKLLYTYETVARMPIFIVREGKNANGMGLCISEQNVWSWTGWSGVI